MRKAVSTYESSFTSATAVCDRRALDTAGQVEESRRLNREIADAGMTMRREKGVSAHNFEDSCGVTLLTYIDTDDGIKHRVSIRALVDNRTYRVNRVNVVDLRCFT